MITFANLGNLGRLGNQLFQIAATIGVATINNDVAIFPRWKYRAFFKNKIKVIDKRKLDKITTRYEPSVFQEITYSGNVSLEGYFQNEQYFKHCEHVIRYYFTSEESISTWLKNKYPLNSNTCSIHVRRDDYLTLEDRCVCGMGYYNKALQHIKNCTTIDNFFVFSDDIPWCKDNFPSNFNFIEGNNDIVDLFLMSFCKYNIIANSSFSWWGGWLNNHENKIVVAPQKWSPPNSTYKQTCFASNTIIIDEVLE